MANCPRCGAENQPDRAACWNCWAPLAATSDAADPAASSSPASAAPAPPVAVALERSITQPPAPVPMPSDSTEVWAVRTSDRPEEVEPDDRAGSPWGRILLVALAIALLGSILVWRFTFHPKSTVPEYIGVAQAYVTALANRDTQTQQQLATDSSKGLQLPNWMTVASGIAQQPVAQGKTATLQAQLVLSPFTRDPLPPAVVAAVSRPYTFPLRLVLEKDGWRVDQRLFLEALKKKLKADNPDVEFPQWE